MGCATNPDVSKIDLPRCPIVTIQVVEDVDGSVYYVMDEQAMAMLMLTQHGLQNGTCRIVKGESI